MNRPASKDYTLRLKYQVATRAPGLGFLTQFAKQSQVEDGGRGNGHVRWSKGRPEEKTRIVGARNAVEWFDRAVYVSERVATAIRPPQSTQRHSYSQCRILLALMMMR